MAGKLKKSMDAQTQDEFVLSANARKVMSGILVPGAVIADITAAAIKVGAGSILRIRVASATFVAFSENPAMAAPSGATTPGIELNDAGVYLIVSTGTYVRSSANPARVELIDG